MEQVLVTKQTKDLVQGEYSAAEAKEILSILIDQKIKFLNIRNLSSQIRYEKSDENCLKRIEELKEGRQSFLEIIDVAREDGKKVKISSKITIELV